MFNNLYISTVIFIIFMQANFHTTHSTSSVSQGNITKTSFTHGNISKTSFTQENITKTSFTHGNITKTSITHGNISGIKRRIPMSDKRISGGTVLKPHSWPFLVILFANNNDTVPQVCGGTVYNESFIITAAHCVKSYKPETVTVTAGEHSIPYIEEREQFIFVSKIIIHPGYTDSMKHDIALLQLSSPLNLKTAYVKAIEINTDQSCPAPNDKCSTAGWGKLSETGVIQDLPSEVVLSVMSISNCKQIKAVTYQLLVSDFTICAGDSKTGKSICTGDSGGPLVCNCGGINKLTGVTSLIHECGNRLYPGIYTRISCYSEWIKTGLVTYPCEGKMGENGSNVLPVRSSGNILVFRKHRCFTVHLILVFQFLFNYHP